MPPVVFGRSIFLDANQCHARGIAYFALPWQTLVLDTEILLAEKTWSAEESTILVAHLGYGSVSLLSDPHKGPGWYKTIPNWVIDRIETLRVFDATMHECSEAELRNVKAAQERAIRAMADAGYTNLDGLVGSHTKVHRTGASCPMPSFTRTDHPHEVTCPECLKMGPSLFYTSDGGYAIPSIPDGCLVYCKPPKARPFWAGSTVPAGVGIVQVAGPSLGSSSP